MVLLQRGWWFGVIVSFCFLVYVLSPVLTPFLVAAMLAYLGDPLADWLESKKLNRTLAVIIVFILLSFVGVVFVLMMIPMLKQQVELVAAKAPVAIDFIKNEAMPWLTEKLGTQAGSFDFQSIEQTLKQQLTGNSGLIATVMASITSGGMAIFAWLGNLVLIPVVTFYLLRDWDLLVERVAGLFPRQTLPVVSKLTRECNEVLSAFIRGQLLVMVALGAIYAIGLWIVGLDLALLVGMIAGLASVVPYLGFIVGIVFAIVAGLIQFGDPQALIFIGLVFVVGQMLEGMVLTPLLVGDKIGLHPVAVIFAVLAGGQLFGFTGILLALPAAAVIMVMLRHMHGQYINSSLYSTQSGRPQEPPSKDTPSEDALSDDSVAQNPAIPIEKNPQAAMMQTSTEVESEVKSSPQGKVNIKSSQSTAEKSSSSSPQD